jgi:uncharacterized coiled-coil protein SlyX
MEITMFTQEEKKMLLDLLNSVQVTGNRQQIGKMLEKLDALARKIEAMPVEAVSDQPSAKKPAKK